jgi:hypothetical protein
MTHDPAKDPAVSFPDVDPGEYSACFTVAVPAAGAQDWNRVPMRCVPLHVARPPSRQELTLELPGPSGR